MRMLQYVWRFKIVFSLGIFALIILSVTNTGFLASIKKITDEGFNKQVSSDTFNLPLLLFSLMFIRALMGFFSNFSMRWVARRIVEALRRDAYKRMMALPIRYFDANSAGLLVSKFTYDAEQFSNAATKVILTVVRDSLTAIGILLYMLYIDWSLTLVFVLIGPLMWLYLKKMTPKLRNAGKFVQQSIGEMTQTAEEAIYGQRIVKIFGASDYEFDRFAKVASKNCRSQIRLARMSGLNSMMIEIFAAIALGLIVYYALGDFSAGEFAAFVGALLMLIAPIKNLTSINEDLQVGIAAAQSVFAVIDTPTEIDEGRLEIGRAKGEITFESVTLNYNNTQKPALSNVSFTIKSGEKVALVGHSGGGKTTLVNLLPRFYDIQKGYILLDDVDIRTLKLNNLRSQFSLVSQDVILFNDTIFNNIAYGLLRNASLAEVEAAAKAANALEFILQLPLGLHNEIGDRGVRLSGGQRQRIAIARAILKDAPILLLDEATSALDTESEKHVQAALDNLMRGRTSIVIAHRLSTIENADRILVLNQGKIVESGTHHALLAAKGYYAKLYQKEFS